MIARWNWNLLYILLTQLWVSPTVIVNTWSSGMPILPTHSINSKFHCCWHWKGHRNTYGAHQKTDIHLQAPVPLYHYKQSSGRPISEAAQHFRNIWVYEARTLWKKPFVTFLAFEAAILFSEKAFRFATQLYNKHTFRKRLWRLVSFFFVWHIPLLFPAWCVTFVYTETSILFTIKYLHVLLVVKETVLMASQRVTLCLRIQIKFQCKSTRIICCWVACSCSNISLLPDIYANCARTQWPCFVWENHLQLY